ESDTFTIGGINVDKTAPSLTGATTTAPNVNGWYTGDGTASWTAGDALSGIADADKPADSTVTGEGDDVSTSASVTDRAGNTKSTTVDGIKIDRHDPSTQAAAPSGWQNTDVTVKLSATDNLSG